MKTSIITKCQDRQEQKKGYGIHFISPYTCTSRYSSTQQKHNLNSTTYTFYCIQYIYKHNVAPIQM